VPRAGLSPDAVVDVAFDVIDEEGPAALTFAAVAARVGVAAPSLYNHVGSLAELRTLVSVRIMEELTERCTEAGLGRSGDDALRHLMRAYRSYVVAHPERYSAMGQQPSDDPRLLEAGNRFLDINLAVLRGYGLDGEDLIHHARCVRSAAHGFAVLEAARGFGLPQDLDTSYNRLIDMVIAGLRDGTGGAAGDSGAAAANGNPGVQGKSGKPGSNG
jgi:AcrR family transcriptional regulator